MKKLSYRKIISGSLLASLCLLLSCNKNDFLNKKPSSDLVVPHTLEDYQALLDNTNVMLETPVFGEVSSDNIYITDTTWKPQLDVEELDAYLWAQDIYRDQDTAADWSAPYTQVSYANQVLEGLTQITINSSDSAEWYFLQGSALFIRAYAFYNLAQIFSPVYQPTDVPQGGIPLPSVGSVTSVKTHFTRPSVHETYDTIISNLKKACNLLPASTPLISLMGSLDRPSKNAAYALLARVYLSMGDYTNAGLYADSCLKIYRQLINFNDLSRNPSLRNSPFNWTNAETLYQSNLISSLHVIMDHFNANCYADSNLFQSYNVNDLRRYIFFRPGSNNVENIGWSYSGSSYAFSGLAIDEVYLTRAESYARQAIATSNMVLADTALSDLNTLLQSRWNDSVTFVPYPLSSEQALLDTILSERRKELVFRGLRWTDLRRLNADDKANITLTRELYGNMYQLLSQSTRYVLPIPPDVPGLLQNPRQ